MSASTKKPGPRTDPDSALEALKRARKRAEEIAAATGTAIIQWENGRIVRFYPGREPNAASEIEPKVGVGTGSDGGQG